MRSESPEEVDVGVAYRDHVRQPGLLVDAMRDRAVAEQRVGMYDVMIR